MIFLKSRLIKILTLILDGLILILFVFSEVLESW